MPKVPVVAQLSTNKAPDQYIRTQATASAFGGQEAKALSGLGQVVSQVGAEAQAAQNQVDDRNWAVERAQLSDQYNKKAQELYLKTADEGDNFTSGNSLTDYNTKLSELRSQLIGQHQGAGESRARLEMMLSEDESKYSSKALVQHRTSQAQLVQKDVSGYAAEVAQKAADDPGHMEKYLGDLETRLENYRNVTTPQQLDALHQAGIGLVVSSALDKKLQVGDLAGATDLFNQVDILLPAEKKLEFSQKLSALHGAVAKKEAEKSASYARLKAAGVDVADPRVALAVETGITLPAGKVTLSSTIAEYEQAQAAAKGVSTYHATPEEVDRLAKIAKPYDPSKGGAGMTGVFGNSSQGLSHEFLARNVESFASGDMDPLQESFFFSAAAQALSPNQVTGQPGNVSPQVIEAFARRGYDIKQVAGGWPQIPGHPQPPTMQPTAAQPTAAQPTPTDPNAIPTVHPPQADGSPVDHEGNQLQGGTGTQGNSDQSILSPDAAIQESRKYEADGGLLAPQAPLPRKTLFGLTDLTTGPSSTIRSGASRIPIVGGFINTSAVTQAKTYLGMVQKDMVRVFQNNPRFAEGERQAIQDDIKLALGLIDRPDRMKDVLIGLDDAMAVREQNAIETLQSGAVGRDEYVQTLNMLNAITKIRRTLGVPPLVQTPEDVKALKKGDKFRNPEGEVRTVK